MFENYVKSIHGEFPINGTFRISSGSELRSAIRESRVPDTPGIYIIYQDYINPLNVIYIGKAGTMKTDGSFKDQGLSGRLCAKQDGMARAAFFQKKIDELGINNLYFQWFVTFSKQSHIIPAKAEADLLQVYYETCNKLPSWNNSI